MEEGKDSSNGKAKERIIKGARGISLRACVAKAAGWTLEKANSATSQEATTNKQSDSKWHECLRMWREHFQGSRQYMWFSKPSPELGRLRVVGLASQPLFQYSHVHTQITSANMNPYNNDPTQFKSFYSTFILLALWKNCTCIFIKWGREREKVRVSPVLIFAEHLLPIPKP